MRELRSASSNVLVVVSITSGIYSSILDLTIHRVRVNVMRCGI